MKLILRADVDSLGKLGEIVTVKPGYGRNFLIPQGLAMPATDSNLKQFELERNKLQVKADGLRAEAEQLAAKIAATPIEIIVRVGEGDKLYGSVTTSNIGDSLSEKGLDIDRRKIILSEPIRALGEYDVEIRLHPEVRGELKVSIIRHGKPEEVVEEQPQEVPVDENAVEVSDEQQDSEPKSEEA